MTLFDLLLIAFGLAMDAFAVALCKGLALRRGTLRQAALVGLWFGGFQALMPLLGWLAGSRFAAAIADFDHWIAFGLLLLIGGNMLREAISQRGDEEQDASLGGKTMLLLALATSIDALAVGVSFAFLQIRIVPAVALIGGVTFIVAAAGLKLGGLLGRRFHRQATAAGGVILILIGVKILLDHLGVW